MHKFIQIHMLTSYPAALLNRDDSGFAKRIPFGDAPRTRISSQCQKRHWRTFDGEGGLQEIGVPLSLRSRMTFQVRVFKPLLDAKFPEELARLVTDGLAQLVLGNKSESEKAPKPEKTSKTKNGDSASDTSPAENGKEKTVGKTEQVTVLGVQEMDAIYVKAREILTANTSAVDVKDALKALADKKNKTWLENFRAMPCSLDSAMFGRMVTGDVLADMDAAVHVAHAFTVHAEQSEPDYFSVVDDLLPMSDANTRGSGHLSSAELTSGLYYSYVVVDVQQLRQNVTGLRSARNESGEVVAREMLRRLVRIVATVSPGAKLGSTAPYSRAQFMLLETGNAQPRTLANAFLNPVRTTRERPELFTNTCDAMAQYLRQIDAMYGREFDRVWAGMGIAPALVEVLGTDNETSMEQLQITAAGVI